MLSQQGWHATCFTHSFFKFLQEFFMFLRPVALAAAALASLSCAQAQTSNQLYGVVDLSFGSFQLSGTNVSADNKRISKVDGNQMVTSYIGFKGTEDLGDGLKAGFVLESFLRPDVGTTGRNDATATARADVFWGRAANLYLQGDFGKLTIGRQGNLPFGMVVSYNPFLAAFGLSPAVRLTYGRWGNDRGDSGWSNAINYDSPSLSGFTASAQVQLGESADDSEDTSYALGLKYSAGPFSVGGAWQNLRSAEAPKLDLTASQKQTFGLLGMSYDFGVAKLFGQFGQYKNTGYAGALRIKTTLFQLGASVPVTTSGKVLVSYGQSKEKPVEGGTTPDTRHSILTLAYDHYLSKRTDVYVAYMNDREHLTGFETGQSLVFGVRHAF
jgi:predicted porin